MLVECAVLLSLVVASHGEMEGFIVGGEYASILRFPHSAFLSVACVTSEKNINWICGSSVLNQKILLTAGHCVYSCLEGTHITVNLGSVNRYDGVVRSSSSFVLHERYDPVTSKHDIALIKVFTAVKFSARISRVAVMRSPPYKEPARLAGWGLVNEKTREQTEYLKDVDQKVWSNEHCLVNFGAVPRGTICATAAKSSDYASQGDSGSALVVRGYIQIGLVSYKVPSAGVNVIVYTDVGYHYEWILFNAARLYCGT